MKIMLALVLTAIPLQSFATSSHLGPNCDAKRVIMTELNSQMIGFAQSYSECVERGLAKPATLYRTKSNCATFAAKYKKNILIYKEVEKNYIKKCNITDYKNNTVSVKVIYSNNNNGNLEEIIKTIYE